MIILGLTTNYYYHLIYFSRGAFKIVASLRALRSLAKQSPTNRDSFSAGDCFVPRNDET